MQRQTIRNKIRACRRSLSEEIQKDKAQELCQRLLLVYPWQSGMKVAVTQPFDGEISLMPFVDVMRKKGINICLPIIQLDKSLLFAPWEITDIFITNMLGIAEPETPLRYEVHDMDVIIVPLVAVDQQGNRLGMGGGYYDRTLAKVNNDNRPHLIGAAYTCQVVDHLPVEDWDVPLDVVVSV